MSSGLRLERHKLVQLRIRPSCFHCKMRLRYVLLLDLSSFSFCGTANSSRAKRLKRCLLGCFYDSADDLL